MVVASCSKEPVQTEPVVVNGTQMTFTACAEVPGADTRTTVVNTNLVYWSPGDVLSVFYGPGSNGGSRFVSSNTEVCPKADFSGIMDQVSPAGGAQGNYFWAAYPFIPENVCDGVSVTVTVPGEQEAIEGSFDPYSFPSVARSTGTELQFYNVCGGLIIELSDPDIESVTVSSNNGEAVAGKVKVSFGADKRPYVREVVDGLTSVTLSSPSLRLSTGCKYYISLLPATLTKGFSITVNKGNSASIKVFPKARTLRRSTFGSMSGFDDDSDLTSMAVDLGVSVKWASLNVGATKPDGYGTFFCWGETAPKDNYVWGDYCYFGTSSPIIKYNIDPYNGTPDYKTVLEPMDDAATIVYGSPWRLPTRAEFDELLTGCTWTWTIVDNTPGYTVSGNGNSIFIPAAGYRTGTSQPEYDKTLAYWTSTLSNDNCENAVALSGNQDGFGSNQFYPRFYGLPVRAVYSAFVPVESISFADSTPIIMAGESCPAPAYTITPSNATSTDIVWVSGNESVAEVRQDGTVTGVNPGTVTIYAYTSSGVSSSFNVVVKEAILEPVDLGLSVMWAPFNMEASAPEEAGGYFAWGEMSSKRNFGWNNYSYCDGSSTTLTRYNYDQAFGAVDYKSVLDLDDDIAAFSLGYPWRLPSKAEMEELVKKSTITPVKVDGELTGYEVTGPNGNSIFLPACGYKEGSSVLDDEAAAGYWTSSVDKDQASALWFRWSKGPVVADVPRFTGLAIRAVYGTYTPVSELMLSAESVVVTGLNFTYTPVTCTVLPEDATDKSILWVSDNESIVKVNQSTGELTTVAPGTATITIYASNGVSSCFTCTVYRPQTSMGGKFSNNAVDMGLSVKWSAWNIGATSATAAGSYYAWGEISTKDRYTWDNYTYYGGSRLDVSKDIACDLLGGKWRMPTKAEVEELIADCFWTYTEMNGVKGYRITPLKSGYSSSYLFLPAAGYKAEALKQKGQAGYYWSSDKDGESGPAYLGFDADGPFQAPAMDACLGFTVRPVLDF